mgnify:CR=1 FL=1
MGRAPRAVLQHGAGGEVPPLLRAGFRRAYDLLHPSPPLVNQLADPQLKRYEPPRQQRWLMAFHFRYQLPPSKGRAGLSNLLNGTLRPPTPLENGTGYGRGKAIRPVTRPQLKRYEPPRQQRWLIAFHFRYQLSPSKGDRKAGARKVDAGRGPPPPAHCTCTVHRSTRPWHRATLHCA